eukprot:m.148867 g.148867  ORF g.148867 m.148867 type:complete len:310 (+) comp13266_c3_seq4:216-1145(+)
MISYFWNLQEEEQLHQHSDGSTPHHPQHSFDNTKKNTNNSGKYFGNVNKPKPTTMIQRCKERYEKEREHQKEIGVGMKNDRKGVIEHSKRHFHQHHHHHHPHHHHCDGVAVVLSGSAEKPKRRHFKDLGFLSHETNVDEMDVGNRDCCDDDDDDDNEGTAYFENKLASESDVDDKDYSIVLDNNHHLKEIPNMDTTPSLEVHSLANASHTIKTLQHQLNFVSSDDEEGEHNFHYEEVKDPFMKEYLRNPREGSTFSSPPFVPRRRIADCWVKEQNFDRTATHYRNTFTNEVVLCVCFWCLRQSICVDSC